MTARDALFDWLAAQPAGATAEQAARAMGVRKKWANELLRRLYGEARIHRVGNARQVRWAAGAALAAAEHAERARARAVKAASPARSAAWRERVRVAAADAAPEVEPIVRRVVPAAGAPPPETRAVRSVWELGQQLEGGAK